MKRFVSIVLCCLLALTAFAGCASVPEADDGRLHVIATVYSEYDWALNIAQGLSHRNNRKIIYICAQIISGILNYYL